MKRKVNLLLILVLCVAIAVAALSACGNLNKDKAPEEIGKTVSGDEVIDKAEETDAPLALRFLFTEYMSSIFTAIPISEFRISSIKMQIVYASTGLPFSEELYDLSEEYVDDDCKKYLTEAGAHDIKVTYPLGDKRDPAIGSFKLNLASEAEKLETVLLKFKLNGGEGWSFGSESGEDEISIRVQKGATYNWNEFCTDFIFKKQGFIVDGISSDTQAYAGKVPFGRSSTATSITFDSDGYFMVNWTQNTVKVHFDLRAPQTELIPGADPSRIDAETADQDVVMFTGTVRRPDSNVINVFAGWNFAGWRDRETDQPWQFAQAVLDHDVYLYGHWIPKDYSLTVFTMGASFKANLESTLTSEQLKNYTLINSKVNFDETTHEPNDISFEGLSYNTTYDKYATNLRIDANDPSKVVLVRLVDILTMLEKAGGIFESNGIYKESTAENKIKETDSIVINTTAYINWVMPESVKEDAERLSDYYINYAFKNGISVNADGSLSIDSLKDASITELYVPATLIWTDGVVRPVTEIGDKACLNAKSLVKIDMSKASNLKRIGSHAFALCNSLKTVDFGDGCAVQEIGEQAFASTPWELDYAKRTGKKFIIVNDVIYKYAGVIVNNEVDFSAETIDLTIEDFALDGKMYSIAAGCFAGATSLRSISLSDNIGYIHNYAFRNLANLENVSVGANSKLYYVAENAFHNCSAFLTVDNANNVTDGRTLVIGKVLYKMFDVNATTYTVQEGIESIAPLAFGGCSVLEEIKFEKESDIKHIGKDAFIDTPWIQNIGGKNTNYQEGFTVINHILAAFCSEEFTRYDVTIPSGVTKIAEYAFNSYARYVRTVEFKEGVEEIENYAFAGASSMRSFIFSDGVKSSTGLANIPSIGANSFANSKGKLLDGVKFYFIQEVVTYLGTDGCAVTNPDWYDLHKLFGNAFAVETISGVWINPSVQNKFIKVSNEMPFENMTNPTDDLGNPLTAVWGYENGIVIESNTGVLKHDWFIVKTNDNVKYPSNIVTFNEAEGEHILVFKYKGSEAHCHNNESDEHAFKYILAFGVSGLAAPSEVGEFNCDDLTSEGNFWIEGFEGDVAGAEVPTFYTSHTSLDLSKVFFCYKDVFYADAPENEKASHIHKIAASRCAGYIPTANRESLATFTFNFNGIGNYIVTMSYRGTPSLYTNDENGIGIYQRSSISIPLNGNPTNYIRNTYVYFKGQDGREQRMVFNLNTFNLESVEGYETVTTLPTDQLGMHVMHVTYSSEDTDGVLFGSIVYNVVLEADNRVFSYEILNEKTKTAKITYCSNTTAETLVIPNVYVRGDVEYTIVEIGDEVFEEFSALKTIYLPSTIKRIGANAFKNCSLLEQVYTSTQTPFSANETGEQPIGDEDFLDLSIENVAYGEIEISQLLFTILPNTITVPETLTWSESVVENEGLENETRIETTYIATPRFKLNDKGEDVVFEKFKGTIWLFDNEYNHAYAEAHLTGKDVKFYTADDNRVPAAQSRFQLDHSTFKESVVYTTKYAKLLDLMREIGGVETVPTDANGNVVVEPYFVMPIKVTVKAADGTTNVVMYRNAKVAQKEGLIALGADDELVSYSYNVGSSNGRAAIENVYVIRDKKSGESRTVKAFDFVAEEGRTIVSINAESDYISATDGEITVPDGFTGIVYLPDSIYNLTSVKYVNGEIHNELLVVYKSGTEMLVSTLAYCPSSLEYIGSGAFESCVSLEEIKFGEGSKLEDICTMAFIRSGVKTLDLSTTQLKELNISSFERCSRLTKVILPEGLLVLNEYAFYHCENLKEINLPSTVTTLGYRVFSACESIEEITIPDSLVNFDYWAFNKCYGIETINMPDRFLAYVKSFRDTAWYGNLSAETVGGVDYLGNVAIGINSEATVTSISLRPGTVAIANEAFKEHPELVSAIIPASVKVIGFDAFLDDVNLKTITYGGTKANWDELFKDANFDSYVGVVDKETSAYDKDYTVVCTDGSIVVRVAKA